MSNLQPPKFAEQVLQWSLPEELKEPILGDLEEEFIQQLSINPISAHRWYRRQAFKSAWQFIRQTKRKLIMFLLSILVFIGFTIMGMWMAGGVTMFIDIPSILILVPASLAFTVAASSWSQFKSAFVHAMEPDSANSAIELKVSKRILGMFGNVSLWIGFAMTVLGWVAIGSNLDDVSQFGPAFAVSILTVLYALFIKIVCYVFAEKIELKLSQEEG